jgi:sugar lactone lactonase YvrE
MKKIILTILITFITVNICNSQSPVIIAGTGTSGYSGNGGNAINAQLNYPRFLVFDNMGNLYFTEQNNHLVRKIDINGLISTIAGNGIAGYSGDGGFATSSQLNSPRGICIDINGNIYIGDYGNNAIRKITPNGIINTIAGNGVAGFFGDGNNAINSQLNGPRGIAIDSQGNIIFADGNNYRIRKIDTNNLISTIAGSGLNYTFGNDGPALLAGFVAPYGIAIYNNNIYISDTNGNCVRKINELGIISNIPFGNGAPSGLTFDSVGNLFVGELSGQIFKVDNLGNSTLVIGTGLSLTTGVTFDTNYNLFFSDTDNNQIKKISNSFLSINQNELVGNIKIYPNPTVDYINIVTKESLKVQNIKLYDVTGKLLENIKEDEINSLNSYNSLKKKINTPGIFLLRITSNEGIFHKRIIRN